MTYNPIFLELGATVKFYPEQNDKNGLLICAHSHAQWNILLPVVVVNWVESTKPHLITLHFLLSFPTQEDSWAQPQVHMEDLCQLNQEMAVRN